MVYAYAYVCVHTQEISIVKTAVLSQQGRFWQSADRPTFIHNLSRSELPRKLTFISRKPKT